MSFSAAKKKGRQEMRQSMNRAEDISTAESTGPISFATRGYPCFSHLSISPFSPLKQDLWIRESGDPHRYQIMLMPEYRVPSAINKNDIDSIWFEGKISEPLVVWDHFTHPTLFEIISECFDPAGEVSDFIRVYDTKDERFIDDPRSPEFLAGRPVRTNPGDILSEERHRKRNRHFKRVKEYTSENSTVEMRRVGYSNVYVHNYDSMYGTRGMRRSCAERHQNLRRGFCMSMEDRFVVPGLMFGLVNFENELAKFPKWHLRSLEIEYDFNNGLLTDPYVVAKKKKTSGVPLSKADEKVLSRGSRKPAGSIFSRLFR